MSLCIFDPVNLAAQACILQNVPLNFAPFNSTHRTMYGKLAETSEHCRELRYASALSTSIQWTKISKRGETRVISKMAFSRTADLLKNAVGELERVNPDINQGTGKQRKSKYGVVLSQLLNRSSQKAINFYLRSL